VGGKRVRGVEGWGRSGVGVGACGGRWGPMTSPLLPANQYNSPSCAPSPVPVTDVLWERKRPETLLESSFHGRPVPTGDVVCQGVGQCCSTDLNIRARDRRACFGCVTWVQVGIPQPASSLMVGAALTFSFEVLGNRAGT
jgi:hypothetical protein